MTVVLQFPAIPLAPRRRHPEAGYHTAPRRRDCRSEHPHAEHLYSAVKLAAHARCHLVAVYTDSLLPGSQLFSTGFDSVGSRWSQFALMPSITSLTLAHR